MHMVRRHMIAALIMIFIFCTHGTAVGGFYCGVHKVELTMADNTKIIGFLHLVSFADQKKDLMQALQEQGTVKLFKSVHGLPYPEEQFLIAAKEDTATISPRSVKDVSKHSSSYDCSGPNTIIVLPQKALSLLVSKPLAVATILAGWHRRQVCLSYNDNLRGSALDAFCEEQLREIRREAAQRPDQANAWDILHSAQMNRLLDQDVVLIRYDMIP